MKKILPVLALAMCLCVGCQESDKNNIGEEVVTDDDNGIKNEQITNLEIQKDHRLFIGEDDLEYGYGKVVFFDSNMKVIKYFDNAVLPNNSMGEIDMNKPIVVGQLDEEKRKGTTAIEPSQYTYGLYNLKEDNWLIPMEYSELKLYDNGCYGAYQYDKDTDTTSMKLYDANGTALGEDIDVTNMYSSCLGDNIWIISYDGGQPIQIYNNQGERIGSVASSYGNIHGNYFVASNKELGDVIYDSEGNPIITKETILSKGVSLNVSDQNFYVIDYHEYSNLIEAQLGNYQLILDNKGNIISYTNQEIQQDTVVEVEYWVYCVTKIDAKNSELDTESELFSKDDFDSTNNQDSNVDILEEKIQITTGVKMNPKATEDPESREEKGIVTDKENPIYDMTRANAKVSYYDKNGNHLVTTKGEEFQGHLQPYGEDYIPHNLYYKTETGFEIYDYESKESYQFDIGEMGIVELQSPMQNYFLITNELDDETNIYLYYKNTLIAENANLAVQVLKNNLILTNYSEEYAFDEISIIYNKEGKRMYESPCYEMIEEIGEKYILTQREGIRTIVDYKGNVIYSFDKKIEVEE